MQLEAILPTLGSIYLFDLLRYLIAAAVVSWILYGMAKTFSAQRKIQKARQATAKDIRRELLYSCLTVGVYAIVGVAFYALHNLGYMKLYSDVADYGWFYAIVSVPLLLVLHDAYFYWVHRTMHHRALFRHFHRVHHLSRTPTPWAAYAFAPGEALMMALFVPLAIFFIPVHTGALLAFVLIMIFRNAQGHSGVEFHPRWWVDSPCDALTTVTHHDLHHQRFSGNYGLYFTWWDRWMGTEFKDYKQQFHQAIDDPVSAEPPVQSVAVDQPDRTVA